VQSILSAGFSAIERSQSLGNAHLKEMQEEVCCSCHDAGYFYLMGKTHLLDISSHSNLLFSVIFRITLSYSASTGRMARLVLLNLFEVHTPNVVDHEWIVVRLHGFSPIQVGGQTTTDLNLIREHRV
jgi:hypothetical protein